MRVVEGTKLWRAMMAAATELDALKAKAIEAGTDETAQQAQPEGRKRGPKASPE